MRSADVQRHGGSSRCLLAFWAHSGAWWSMTMPFQVTLHFKIQTLWNVKRGAREQMLRRTRRTCFGTVYKLTSLQGLIIEKKKIHISEPAFHHLHLPYFLLMSSPLFSFSCSLSAPLPPPACFPSEGEELLNMEEEEWNRHQHDMPLTLSFTQIPLSPHLLFVFPPRPPLAPPLLKQCYLQFVPVPWLPACWRYTGSQKHYFVCMKVLLSCRVGLYGVLRVWRFSVFPLMLI